MTDDRNLPGDLPTDEDDIDTAVDPPHRAEDMATGQGSSDDAYAVPAEDVAQLAGIRDPVDQTAVTPSEEIDRLGTITDTRVLEGDLEARPIGGDQPDEPDVDNLELLVEDELRDGETDDPGEAAEEGLTYVPPVDPPVSIGDNDPQVLAGFGTTADDEPFDADHHGEALYALDERTERVREALASHAETAGLVDRLSFDTIGSRIVIEGTVDDLDDEEQILGVISELDGITEVVNRIEIAALE
jgi:hypothetical protein